MREIMKRAHQIARGLEGDYRARMSLALRQAWEEKKMINAAELRKVYVVRGKTYENKETLKQSGYKWDATRRLWMSEKQIEVPAGCKIEECGYTKTVQNNDYNVPVYLYPFEGLLEDIEEGIIDEIIDGVAIMKM